MAKMKITATGFMAGNPDMVNIGAALWEEGEEIMTESKTSYVPVVTGNLMGTGTVGPPEISVSSASVTLSYGGPGGAVAPYARVVHESPPDWGQGKPKYLEEPMLLAKAGFSARMAARLKARGVI